MHGGKTSQPSQRPIAPEKSLRPFVAASTNRGLLLLNTRSGVIRTSGTGTYEGCQFSPSGEYLWACRRPSKTEATLELRTTSTLEVIACHTFPDPTGYQVIVPLGARWPVYDETLRRTWVGAETQFLRDAADAGVALLGVCFGGQLLAQAFGGSVARAGVPEIGWYDVETDNPDLVPGGPWFQWHFDRWTLPPGATEIARTANASQAFVLGRALALQFHPEIDLKLLDIWLDEDRDDDVVGAGLSHDELRDRTTELADDVAKRIRDLVRGFLTQVAR